MSLSFIILFIFSLGAVQADCIVTTQNFSKSSRVIYVNPTNGSDQLAKIYNYNLANQRNPYEPKRIVAFQNLDEALATRNTRNGDLVLIKTGRTWTKYDDWSQNKSSEFNKQSAQASGYSQRQCQGENLTWVPSAVTDTQSADTAPAPTTEFANTDDITVANTEIVTSRNITPNQVATASQTSISPTTSRRSSGGSSSGGSNSGADTLSNVDNSLPLEQNETTSYSRGSNKSTLQNTLTETPFQGEIIAELDSDLTESVVIDEDVTAVVNEPENLNQDYAAECTANAPWGNAIQTYPKDSQGWSIIKPDIETKIVYVSSSEGDDSSGQTYNGVGIDDPFNPGNVKAYKTIEKAYAQTRSDKPDWILLKKGDNFILNNILWLKSGKSQQAHFVFGAYGEKNAKRPLIDTGKNSALQGIKNRSYITVVGLDFYASALDPKSDKFLGWNNTEGGSAFTSVAGTGSYGNYVEGIHLENNRIDSYRNGIMIVGSNNKNIVIRRNQVLNSYNVKGHSQGVGLGSVHRGLIEENIFDHNGWYQQRPLDVDLNTPSFGYATFFNHNVYISSSSDLVIRKNLSSRSSSIGIKFASNSNNETKTDTINSANILIENNLIIEGEVGFSIGGNTDFNNGYRWDNIQVINNVLSNIGRTKPTNRNLSFNIEANDWKTGTICSNTIVDRDDKSISGKYGIVTNGHVGDIIVADNRIVNFGIETESYSSRESVQSNNNIYTPLLNVNYLDSYVKSEGYSNYDAYISNVINNLRNSSSSFYDVTKPIKYIEASAR